MGCDWFYNAQDGWQSPDSPAVFLNHSSQAKASGPYRRRTERLVLTTFGHDIVAGAYGCFLGGTEKHQEVC